MRLSVVIPTLDEAERLERALDSLPDGAECIVSDGGSRDATAAVARARGALLVEGDAGRAVQLNRGAARARGDTLLFLHADCRLPPGAGRAIEDALGAPDVVGGSFRLRIEPAGPALRLVAFGSNLRARWLGLPYGDQALFARRKTFEAVGGFPEVPLLEDVGLVRRLRRCGRLVALPLAVTTDPRHWEALGPVRTTLLNAATIALYAAGVPPERLAPIYRRLRGRRAARAGRPGLASPSLPPPPPGPPRPRSPRY